MNKRGIPVLLLFSLACTAVQAQQTIEGFWQDVAGRTTFKRNALPADTYGAWNERELDATYPQAKLIRKSASSFELTDLNYDESDYSVRVVHAEAGRIAFVRKPSWSACRMEHDCRLDGAELFCSMQNVCPQDGRDVVEWRGDERYIRREHCQRDGSAQMQGIPVKCR
ncbi:MAG TPA: hypothetical protein VFB01_10295 [Burkholderiales bacterium]|nr:hypothetical protein [Burkholderiales bacterium]